ncbi:MULTISPECIES: response regulator transcription factor [unclassified Undibacterium]|uniref:response regulator transcription factor n=1 Tax=unclassified Undibacterium TaxID=2630295 RepID=UPI002AC9217A|nr:MULTISPECIES: response regulator [unclassified Undibacterium]MEB0140664.1 response regulator [Undibacterium sp. CCC2.1]MEB0172428.1 response regulator [Undibacterium sp. CCC1.1]MEB0177682.1 response regulator [Undibacterium sp. CCC3.4]MEB0215550.1 response regulator [Undibacterium sp. 5I2]WPX43743.1 response regulator [Undibacterium sp. CCC3.4]
MNETPLMLYVVDDDEALRRSLHMLLFSQGLPVQSFDTGESFLATVDHRKPGCVVLDLRMAGISGLSVLAELKLRHSPLVALFLSGHGDIPTALEAVRLGAYDWIVKPDVEQLLEKLPSAISEAHARAHALQRWSELTVREREVARLVCLGYSNKDIARQLLPPAGPRTVETHRSNIFDKLNLANANELSRWLSLYNWLD